MKKVLPLFIPLLILCRISYSQNIGINATGALPNASAMLDVSAPNKGILIPRTSSSSRIAIPNPAKGLMLYDTTSNSFWYHNGTLWIELNVQTTGTGNNSWSTKGSNIFNNNIGNVGIGINTPLAGLHIRKDLEAIRLQGTSSFLSFYNREGDSLKSFVQNYGDNFYIGTPAANSNGLLQFYVKNEPLMTLTPSGNIGIGTTTPADKFTVNTFGFGLSHSAGTATVGTFIGNFQGITTVKFGTKTNNSLNFFTANSAPQMTLTTAGYVGIGTQSPLEKLTIQTTPNQYGISHRTDDGGILSTYFGGTSAGIGTFSNTNMRLFANGLSAMFIEAGTRNVGIGVDFPSNKLQIGGMGSSGFATNDFAIGNGTNAMAIYQTNVSTLFGSTTDIVLKPRNNGSGFVGINTDFPRAPLEVAGFGIVNDGYYAYMNGTGDLDGIGLCKFCDPTISIIAANGVYASEFDAFSDVRIKDVIGGSNTIKDLELINALQITDYTMKDKVRYGGKIYKKVIAQEVEAVYPQVVSRHTDFIPNVYQVTSKVEKADRGYVLTFANAHHLGKDAKRLQALVSQGNNMQQFDIINIPSEKQVVINAKDINVAKIFVFGEEVNDFRTVDYEGLTTLNISATQELSKQLAKQKVQIIRQEQQLDLLEKRLALLERK